MGPVTVVLELEEEEDGEDYESADEGANDDDQKEDEDLSTMLKLAEKNPEWKEIALAVKKEREKKAAEEEEEEGSTENLIAETKKLGSGAAETLHLLIIEKQIREALEKHLETARQNLLNHAVAKEKN